MSVTKDLNISVTLWAPFADHVAQVKFIYNHGDYIKSCPCPCYKLYKLLTDITSRPHGSSFKKKVKVEVIFTVSPKSKDNIFIQESHLQFQASLLKPMGTKILDNTLRNGFSEKG